MISLGESIAIARVNAAIRNSCENFSNGGSIIWEDYVGYDFQFFRLTKKLIYCYLSNLRLKINYLGSSKKIVRTF